MKIVLATNNQGKIREIKAMLKDLEILSLKDIGFDKEIIEDGNSFLENALIKAKTVSDYCHLITVADDSGICVDALNGAPGIYSARYAGTDIENTNKLLKNMEGIKNRKAHFACTVVIYYPDGSYKSYDGKMEGLITTSPKGTNGFGYDPIMFLPQYGMTSAEIPSEEKNKISHRAIAIRKMVEDLK